MDIGTGVVIAVVVFIIIVAYWLMRNRGVGIFSVGRDGVKAKMQSEKKKSSMIIKNSHRVTNVHQANREGSGETELHVDGSTDVKDIRQDNL